MIAVFFISIIIRGGSTSACEIGHFGPLCGDCEPNYSKAGNDCVVCMGASVNMLQLITVVFLYVGFLVFYVM